MVFRYWDCELNFSVLSDIYIACRRDYDDWSFYFITQLVIP